MLKGSQHLAGGYATLLAQLKERKFDIKSELRLGYPSPDDQGGSILTMFETDQIPGEWPRLLKRYDRVIVPSQFCQWVYAKEGVKTELCELGVEIDNFPVIDRPKRDTFTFLHYNAFTFHKGWDLVVQAFKEEFEGIKDVRLILKTVIQLPPSDVGDSRMRIVGGQLTNDQMLDLMAESDCFVYPSRGEGWGLPPLEAGVTGMPVIVSNAHSHTEWFNPDLMYGVGIRGYIKASLGHFRRGTDDIGHWVEPSLDELKAQMRYVYEHQDEARANGLKLAKYVRKYYTADKFVERLSKLFKDEVID